MRAFILIAILLAAFVTAVPGDDTAEGATGSNVASGTTETGGNAGAGSSDQSKKLFRISKQSEKQSGQMELREQDWHMSGEPGQRIIRPAENNEPTKGLSTFESREQAKEALANNNIRKVPKDKKEAAKKKEMKKLDNRPMLE
jgi:hypothetical protein